MQSEEGGFQSGGQFGVGTGGMSIGNNKPQDDQGGSRPTQYSMPGILHFLQTEWARFEMERSQFEVERAELQVTLFMTIDLDLDLNYRSGLYANQLM